MPIYSSPAHLSELWRCQDGDHTLPREREVVPQVGGALCISAHPAEGIWSDCISQVDLGGPPSARLATTIGG